MLCIFIYSQILIAKNAKSSVSVLSVLLNSQSSELRRVFCLTNASSQTFAGVGAAIEIADSENNWIAGPSGCKPRFYRLDPRSGTVVSIKEPAEGERWRVRFSVQQKATGIGGCFQRIKYFWRLNIGRQNPLPVSRYLNKNANFMYPGKIHVVWSLNTNSNSLSSQQDKLPNEGH